VFANYRLAHDFKLTKVTHSLDNSVAFATGLRGSGEAHLPDFAIKVQGSYKQV